jgi:hypothetical protein
MYTINERLVLYLTLADVVGGKRALSAGPLWSKFNLKETRRRMRFEGISHCGNVTNKFLGYLNTFGELSVNAFGVSGTWPALHYCRISYWIGCSVDHTAFVHVVRMEVSSDCICPALKSLAFTGRIRISDWSLKFFRGEEERTDQSRRLEDYSTTNLILSPIHCVVRSTSVNN